MCVILVPMSFTVEYPIVFAVCFSEPLRPGYSCYSLSNWLFKYFYLPYSYENWYQISYLIRSKQSHPSVILLLITMFFSCFINLSYPASNIFLEPQFVTTSISRAATFINRSKSTLSAAVFCTLLVHQTQGNVFWENGNIFYLNTR